MNLVFIQDTDPGALTQIKYITSYLSKSLWRPERNYSVTRRKFYAMVECVKHFFTIFMEGIDALNWFMSFKNPEGKKVC